MIIAVSMRPNGAAADRAAPAPAGVTVSLMNGTLPARAARGYRRRGTRHTGGVAQAAHRGRTGAPGRPAHAGKVSRPGARVQTQRRELGGTHAAVCLPAYRPPRLDPLLGRERGSTGSDSSSAAGVSVLGRSA